LSRLFTAAALLCVLAGCIGRKPVVYLDHAWSLYYAKNNCYLNLPQGDRDPALQGCLSDEIHGLESFEKILLFQLGMQSDCAGVVIEAAADRPVPQSPFWRLLISLDDVEGKHENWDLMSPKSRGMRHGAGDAREIAQQVCAIAKRGA
jgi:hypothetical protein